jgi:hypothetical protein
VARVIYSPENEETPEKQDTIPLPGMPAAALALVVSLCAAAVSAIKMPKMGSLGTTSTGSHTYCAVQDSGMQGHQWDAPPALHHWTSHAEALKDCNTWADCAGYYMHPNKVGQAQRCHLSPFR